MSDDRLNKIEAKKDSWRRAGRHLDIDAIEKLCLIEWDQKSIGMMLPFFLAHHRLIVPALVAELREHREAIEALGAVFAIPNPSDPMGAVQQFLLYVKERDARVRELEGERSKETMWAIQRVLELEEEAVGLKAALAEAASRLDEMGAI